MTACWDALQSFGAALLGDCAAIGGIGVVLISTRSPLRFTTPALTERATLSEKASYGPRPGPLAAPLGADVNGNAA